MTYNYQTQKAYVLTDDGSADVIKIKNYLDEGIEKYGAVMSSCVIFNSGLKLNAGETWDVMACIDRLVELGEINEIKQAHMPAGQHRVFTKY